MLLIKVQEIWNWDVHLIVAPNKVSSGLFFFFLDALSILIKLYGFLYGVRDGLEYFFLVGPEHSLFHDFEAVDGL